MQTNILNLLKKISTQEKILNDKITNLTPVSLYSNISGSNGTITLNESATNFNIIDIIYKNSDNSFANTRVIQPNGKIVILEANSPFTDAIYFRGKMMTINEQYLQLTYDNSYSYMAASVNNNLKFSDNNNIRITNVIGYK